VIVYFGGQYMPMHEAHIGILTHALHYGTGVFEGIRAYWNAAEQELFVMRPRDHYVRWKQNGGILHIDVPLTAEQLSDITVELAQRNAFRTDLYIRPLAYKCAERIGVSMDDQDAFFIVALPFGEYLHSENGLHAGVSSWRRIDDNAIPARGKICGAYANSALASDEARRSGFDEAILLNESGHVTEGATCNLFMLPQGAVDYAGRDGERTGRHHARFHHGTGSARAWPGDCGAAHRPQRAVRVRRAVPDRNRGGLGPGDARRSPCGADGAIGVVTRSLRQLYVDATHGRMPAYRKWLLPVYRGAQPAERNEALKKETSLA
jgi:branched-chain amino acid aminotransferase